MGRMSGANMRILIYWTSLDWLQFFWSDQIETSISFFLTLNFYFEEEDLKRLRNWLTWVSLSFMSCFDAFYFLRKFIT